MHIASALAVPALQPAVCLHIDSVVRASMPSGSFHQALWPSAAAVPALQPAVCLHIDPVVRAFKPAVCQLSSPYNP